MPRTTTGITRRSSDNGDNGDNGLTASQTPGGAGTGETMTIGELSELTGMSVSAIRFYQRRGLLPARDGGPGWQRFGRETLDRLAVIELAKSAGFSLDEVIRILDALDTDPDAVPDTAPVWHGLAEHKMAEIDRQLRRLQAMRHLLKDAVDYSYISPDRASQVPAALGWTVEHTEHTALPHPVQVPTSTRDLPTD